MDAVTLTPDMRAVVEAAHLCFAATVTPAGRPNVSPKGTVRVWDDAHHFFLDIASPGTRANLAHAPWMELNVVDQLSRRGYRFSGRAALHGPGDAVYAEATRRVFGEEGARYDVAAVVLLAVERAEPLVSPGYQHVPDEAAMRAAWAARRQALDRAFEAHLAAARDDRRTLAASYDRLAAEYARRVAGELAGKPFDRALLDAFAERVRGAGPVADVGCGPGHVAAYLRARGVEALGVDLSPGMVEEARGRYPDVPFRVGDVTALDVPGGAWAAAVAFYSLIHLERPGVAAALRELRRVLRPGGVLLVAFHVGTEVRRVDELWGVPVDLAFVFFTPDEMRALARAAGFVVERCEERGPYPEVEAQTRRCYLVARAAGGPERRP